MLCFAGFLLKFTFPALMNRGSRCQDPPNLDEIKFSIAGNNPIG